MVKLVLVCLAVIASLAIAFPAQHGEGIDIIPARIVRAADPDPGHRHHYYRGHGGYGGGFGGGYGNSDLYHGNHGHGGHGYHDHGYGGYNNGGGYNNYPQSGANSYSNANAAAINTPFGSASFATANAGANSGYGK